MKIRYLVIILIILSVASVFIGVSDLSLLQIFNLTETQKQVLFTSRVPRLISIIVAGASMSIVGLIMQQLSRNRFVSPTTAGTMDAARLGILVSIIMFTSATAFQKMIVSFI